MFVERRCVECWGGWIDEMIRGRRKVGGGSLVGRVVMGVVPAEVKNAVCLPVCLPSLSNLGGSLQA